MYFLRDTCTENMCTRKGLVCRAEDGREGRQGPYDVMPLKRLRNCRTVQFLASEGVLCETSLPFLREAGNTVLKNLVFSRIFWNSSIHLIATVILGYKQITLGHQTEAVWDAEDVWPCKPRGNVACFSMASLIGNDWPKNPYGCQCLNVLSLMLAEVHFLVNKVLISTLVCFPSRWST